MSTNSDRRPRLPVKIAYLTAGVLFVAAMLLLASVVNPDRNRDFSMNHVPAGTSATSVVATTDLG
ncbi:hypothetical protein O5Y_20030 [Rhodococcus erythropolis CCM2595]|uniref:hypothetical protein n=1 Tax=Rhodococcus erythropolis TaxID=1833 RepID=UPI00038DC1BB|nr:hypothetical protein [Rhodococcus erythropolis]AGT93833.1 hypothetical protein O5Y_20030 [Rhodococcus erythropolis CCM2595]SUE11813.1 Uncharacterised protein [Rhodococcus erythropolis]